MHVKEQMSYECSDHMYLRLNTYDSSTRSHPSKEETRTQAHSKNCKCKRAFVIHGQCVPTRYQRHNQWRFPINQIWLGVLQPSLHLQKNKFIYWKLEFNKTIIFAFTVHAFVEQNYLYIPKLFAHKYATCFDAVGPPCCFAT